MNPPKSRKCPQCSETYDDSVHYCLNDGTQLVPVDELLGKLLDGRYRIEKLLGQGGMGTVYRATHIHIDALVAVKVLNPELVSNQSAIERFRREAKAAGRIHHPNAIKVTDFGVAEDKTVYLVMELVDGESLRDLLWAGTIFDAGRAVSILTQVSSAVEAAHESGVIHRDLKPDNIIIRRKGSLEEVKVLDFGIAKLKQQENPVAGAQTLTQAGTIIGTPAYMSPEQCRGRELDQRSDIYSLGIIAYEMLTGAPPFNEDSATEIVARHLRDEPPPLSEARPDLPPLLEQAVMRALAKDPANRQQSAEAFGLELQAALGDGLAIDTQLIFRTTDPNRQPVKTSARGSAVVSQGGVQGASVPASPEIKQTLAPARKRFIPLAAIFTVILGGISTYLLWPRSQSSPPDSAIQPGAAIAVEMARIPGGRFLMGRNDGDEDERPAHEVEVRDFYLDKFEVTNQQYKKFTDATGHPLPRHWRNNGSFAPEESLLPVTFVTWQDAADYAKWAGKRLPTEEEWEYATRGGNKGSLYPWGNQWADGKANLNRPNQARPAPVHSFEQDVSSFGVYDLAGNVSEWVQNYFIRYGAGADERYRVYRGGNFTAEPGQSTATYRWYDFPAPPADPTQKKEYELKVFPVVGFRCAKDADR
jgi:serine/threonine-protein kinase